MKVLIIEDELAAARRLRELIREVVPECEILAVIDTVDSTVRWLQNFGCPDLMFVDIQLADGLSFEIFSQIDLSCPVIFTTAFDQYMLQAFRVHSVDYILKPVDAGDLEQAIDKFRKYYEQNGTRQPELKELLASIGNTNQYRRRFLVKRGKQLVHVPVEEIAYFYSEDGVSFFANREGRRFAVDLTLDELESSLDPSEFFRINRGMIVRAGNIHSIHPYFNQRLKLDLDPAPTGDVIVSRERVRDFKEWLGG